MFSYGFVGNVLQEECHLRNICDSAKDKTDWQNRFQNWVCQNA